MPRLFLALFAVLWSSAAVAQEVTGATPATSVSGLAAVATSGSATDLTTGTLPNARLALADYGSGCTLSRSAATTVAIAACATADDTTFIVMPSSGRQAAYTKTLSAWAVGTGNGCLDTGSLGTTKFIYLYQIQRSDTGVVDDLCTITFGSPTMPTSYDRKRFIGSVPMDGAGNILAFTQVRNRVILSAPIVELNNTALSANTAVTLTLVGVPIGYKVLGQFRATMSPGGGANSIMYSAMDAADTASTNGAATIHTSTSGLILSAAFDLMTNTSGQIRQRIQLATATNNWLNTAGWMDPLIDWPH